MRSFLRYTDTSYTFFSIKGQLGATKQNFSSEKEMGQSK